MAPGNDNVGTALIIGWIREFAQQVSENTQYLTDLDAAIGDADHGLNMDRGMKAVVANLDDNAPGDLGAVCKQVATALIMGMPALVGEGLSWRDVRLRTMHASPVQLPPLPEGAHGRAPGSAVAEV